MNELVRPGRMRVGLIDRVWARQARIEPGQMALLRRTWAAGLERRLMNACYPIGFAFGLLGSGFFLRVAPKAPDWLLLIAIPIQFGAFLVPVYRQSVANRRARDWHWRPHERCYWCGYDIDDVPADAPCPECGAAGGEQRARIWELLRLWRTNQLRRRDERKAMLRCLEELPRRLRPQSRRGAQARHAARDR